MPKKRIDKANIENIKNKSGIYKIFSCNGKKPIYVGSSKVLRHRLQSYYQKDDFNVNRTKEPLRPYACKFSHKYMPISKARKLEQKLKQNTKFNVS